MKLLIKYLKQRLCLFLLFLLFFAVFAVSFMLYKFPMEAVLYPFFLCLVIIIFVVVFDFLGIKRRHNTLSSIHSLTDIITGMLPQPSSIQDEDYDKIIRLISDEARISQSQSEIKYADMIDYYTVWAHQIKTPISSMRLKLQNEDSALSRSLMSDLQRIEQYVEMVMTYLRLSGNSTDYVIKEYDLDTIVKSAVKKFSSEFISRKLKLVYEPLNTTVITDEKWLSFVIEQVLSNALKYTPGGSITITLEKEKTLRISDTGLGIAPEDLPRIFENGYTGYNGRLDKRASGIGLYLCRRICTNLGHTISARSTLDVGTFIDIGLFSQRPRFE